MPPRFDDSAGYDWMLAAWRMKATGADHERFVRIWSWGFLLAAQWSRGCAPTATWCLQRLSQR